MRVIVLREGKLSPDGSLALIHAVGHPIDHLLMWPSWFNKYLDFQWTGRFAAVKYNNREIPCLQLDRDNQFAGVGSLFLLQTIFFGPNHNYFYFCLAVFSLVEIRRQRIDFMWPEMDYPPLISLDFGPYSPGYSALFSPLQYAGFETCMLRCFQFKCAGWGSPFADIHSMLFLQGAAEIRARIVWIFIHCWSWYECSVACKWKVY